MKFCKVLEGQDKGIPEFNHIVLRYKQLKKKIKAIPKSITSLPKHAAEASQARRQQHRQQQQQQPAEPSNADDPLSLEEQDFMATLNEDVNRLNAFFMEKEEDAVINLKTMQDQLEQAKDPKQLDEIKGRLVNFHGELVMILHWSLINYSAIVKILKKHDKRSGVLLRAPYLANVLTQPFSSTNVMSRLVKRAEELVEAAVNLASAERKPRTAAAPDGRVKATGQAGRGSRHDRERAREQGRGSNSSDDEGSSLTEVSGEEAVIRRTKLALDMWQSLAKSASTPSTILSSLSVAAADASETCTAPAPSAAAAPMQHTGVADTAMVF